MRRVAYKMPRIMPAQLPTAHPHQPQPNTCRQIGNKVGGWIRPLSYQKGNFDSSVRDKKKSAENRRNDRSESKGFLTKERSGRPGSGGWSPLHGSGVEEEGVTPTRAVGWIWIEVGPWVSSCSQSRGRGGREGGGGPGRAEPSQREPVPSRWPVEGGLRRKVEPTTHTHARTNGGPRQTRRWDHVS